MHKVNVVYQLHISIESISYMSIKHKMEINLPRVLHRHNSSESRSKNNLIHPKTSCIQRKLYRGVQLYPHERLGRTSITRAQVRVVLSPQPFTSVAKSTMNSTAMARGTSLF